MEIETEQLDVDESQDTSDKIELASVSPEPQIEEVFTNQPNQPSKQYFDQFLHNLTNCVTKELIDSAAIDFLLNCNTKNNRKKLSRAVFGVQRTRLDLLPFFARLVAIINLVNRDVVIELISLLKNEFKYLVKKKDQV